MPFDLRKYPSNWLALSIFIRYVRAGNRCECTGQCGKNHAGRCNVINGEKLQSGGKVVLTTAHLDAHGGQCNCGYKCGNESHLLALCQSCHLRYDMPINQAKAKATRYHQKYKDQLRLFEV